MAETFPQRNVIRPEVEPPGSGPGVLRRLLGYIRPYWLYLGLAILVTGLSTGVGLVPPYLTKILVDEALRPGGSGRLLLWIIGGLLGAEVGSLLLSVGRSRLYAWLGGRLTLDVRTGLFQHRRCVPAESSAERVGRRWRNCSPACGSRSSARWRNSRRR